MNKFAGLTCAAAAVGATYLIWSQAPRPQRSFKMPDATALVKAFPGNSRDILEHSQQFFLISVNPQMVFDPDAQDLFHGFHVIGKTLVTDPVARAGLIAALYDSMATSQGAAACFNPRHGIRAMRNGRVVDIAICFHCGQIQVYADGKQGSGDAAKATQPYFDAALQRAGVPLAPS
jgi:hypothetical protein